MSASPELRVPSSVLASGGTADAGWSPDPSSSVSVRIGVLADIPPGEGRAYDARGHQVAVFRLRSGEVRAVQAVCPHRGGPLADGQTDRRVVVCPLHLFAWNTVTGESAAGLDPVRVYPVRVDRGELVVEVPA